MDRGPVFYRGLKGLGPEARQALVRCKARNLIVPLHQGKGYYKYDITVLGQQVLGEHLGTDVSKKTQESQFLG